jgi:hypothetical protein
MKKRTSQPTGWFFYKKPLGLKRLLLWNLFVANTGFDAWNSVIDRRRIWFGSPGIVYRGLHVVVLLDRFVFARKQCQ